MRSPRSITVTESNLPSVNRYNVVAKRHSDNAVLASKNYTPTTSPQVLPIGSDDFFAAVNDGEVIDLYLIERATAGSSADDVTQTVPGGPFTVSTYPDGAETITVQL